MIFIKIYVATKYNRVEEVRDVFEKFKKLGYKVSCDWTIHKFIKPYENNRELSCQYSIEDINAVINCDIFVLITDKAGTGMYVELGAAIIANINYGKPKIYVIGDYINRSMFYFHPSVNRMKTINNVIKDIKEKEKNL